MLEKFLPKVKTYKPAAGQFVGDDFIDRLNDRWTVRALVICIFIVGGNIIWVKHINCWTPNEFGNPHIDYANSICWLKGSYYLPTNEINIPDRSKPRTDFISYYQWTPFILLGMAMLFRLPRFLWHTFPRQGGINIRRIVTIAKDKDAKIAREVLRFYLDPEQQSNGIGGCRCDWLKCMCGHTIAYLSLKILYVINTMTQFFLLNSFLSFQFTSYGFKALRSMFMGDDWFESPTFPRVTMCDFMVRRLGSNQHWYSVQCNLPFNIYNEKIFLGIWFWLIILTILNILSIISWASSLTRTRRWAAIHKYLEISKVLPKEPPSESKTEEKHSHTTEEHRRYTTKEKRNGTTIDTENESLLTTTAEKHSDTTTGKQPSIEDKRPPISEEERRTFLRYLQLDGYMIIRLIGRNTNDAVAAKILRYLYDNCPLLGKNLPNSA